MNEELDNSEFQEEEWVGIAAYQGDLYQFHGIMAEFILDYRAYDPAFSASAHTADFRNGILTVTADNAPQFLRAMKSQKITPQQANSLAASSQEETRLIAFIDFDKRRYIHSYYDLALEEYVPRGWHGKLGDPRQELIRWTMGK